MNAPDPNFSPAHERESLESAADPNEASLRVVPLGSLVRNRFRAKNFLQSVGFALEGLSFIFKTQRNFRIDVLIGVGVVMLGLALGLSLVEWASLILVMTMVMVCETINTAIEYTVDLFTQGEFDMRAKVIKDLSAGACLLSALSAALLGAVVFGPHLLRILL